MELHFNLSDSEFERSFESCSMKPDVFTHIAHLRLAYIHISRYGKERAIENIEAQLQQFVKFAGATNKYHKTLTIVAIHAVHYHMRKSKAEDFKDFLLEFPELKQDFKNLVNSHYSFDIFNSTEAKIRFLEPDLQPFS